MITNNNLLFFRIFCAVAVVLYPLLGFIYQVIAVQPFQECLRQRAGFSLLFLILLTLSFLSEKIYKKYMESLFYLLMFGVALHTIYLISLNDYMLGYAYSILFVIIAGNISFKNKKVLIVYNFFIIALISLTLYRTSAQEIGKLLYFIIVFLIGLVSYLSSSSKLTIEKKLMKESNKQRMLLNNIEAQVWYLKDERTLGCVNQAYADFVGWEREEIENQDIDKVRRANEANSCVTSNEHVFDSKKKVQLEGWVENAEGEMRLLDITKVPKLNEQGEVEYVICTAYDITEQQKTEERLANYAMEMEKTNSQLEQTTAKLNKKIEQARQLHEQFLPASFPNIEGLSFAAYYHPAEQLGGDFYDVIKVENKLILYIVDITGHGLDGAMLNIFVRESINNFLLNNEQELKDISPARIIEFIFTRYCEENFPDDYFICILLGVLDLETWEFVFGNAGLQLPPLLADEQHGLQPIACEGLPISGVIDKELFTYQSLEEQSILFNEGATLLLSTDGLIEEEINGEMYGEERLKEIFLDSYDLAPNKIIEAINDDFEELTGSLQAQDDITIVLIQRGADNDR
ncbi:SpoIIE family protein phosphatase [Fuchsiella alkaliacetigena]|nr:SpoIIE family protein phosphatase [Fuchsiella alkaliacetigena]